MEMMENTDYQRCDICDKRFGRKEDLTRHIRSIHGPANNFECTICDRRFDTKLYLKAHCDNVHNSAKIKCNTYM